MLQDIAQEANFVVTYVDIEELSVSGEDRINFIYRGWIVLFSVQLITLL